MGPTPENPATKTDAAEQAKDPKALKLDALKAIRESAFARWDKRRNYEWILSVAIWTAQASFIALVSEFSATLRRGGGSCAKPGYFGFLLAGLTRRNSLSHL